MVLNFFFLRVISVLFHACFLLSSFIWAHLHVSSFFISPKDLQPQLGLQCYLCQDYIYISIPILYIDIYIYVKYIYIHLLIDNLKNVIISVWDFLWSDVILFVSLGDFIIWEVRHGKIQMHVATVLFPNLISNDTYF